MSSNPRYPEIEKVILAGDFDSTSGEHLFPQWSDLVAHVGELDPESIEYTSVSHVGERVVFVLTYASGQGGVIAVLRVGGMVWEDIVEGSFTICALLIEELHAILSLHYVADFVTPGHHQLFVTELQSSLDPAVSRPVRIHCKSRRSGFHIKLGDVFQFALATAKPCSDGPTGFFYIEDEQRYYAHDAGNLFVVERAEIEYALASPVSSPEPEEGGRE